MNLSRLKSYILIILIYILACFVGVLVYLLLPFETWLSLLIADVSATVFVFAFSVILGNASVYDPYWSVAPVVILAAFLFSGEITLPSILVFLMVLLWGTRLTANWAYTFQGIRHQDWRYSMLHEKTGKLYPMVNFMGIHLVPTLVVYLAVLPAVYVVWLSPDFSPLCLIGFALAILAVLLQGTADIQMHAFRKKRMTPFIETGLWRYSRHPNYLGEILMWWSVAAFSWALLGFHWYLAVGAIGNTLLFLFVSIPLADGRQSAKPGFSDYKARTRMLLPLKK